MEQSRNVLLGKPDGKRLLERPRRRWEDNIKVDLREVGCDHGDWMDLVEVSQIHSPHLHAGAPGIFSNLYKVCSAAKERVGCGKQREATCT